ncbi:hypothetical protein DOJK_00299 [Patescibacteria group bacterium]|nr:hypothetical protein DOJK_00299 [Patescibacteria group bacterium]
MNKIFLSLLLFTSIISAQEIKFSGYGATGYIHYNHEIVGENNQKTYFEGKFQADYKVSKYIDAQLDFRGNSADNSVRLREFSAKFEYSKDFQVRVGMLKKPFGFENLYDTEELPMVDHSYTADRLSELGYSGRSVSLMVYRKHDVDDPEDIPMTYYVSVYKDNSQYYGGIVRYQYHFPLLNIGFSYERMQRSYNGEIGCNGFAIDISRFGERSLVDLELSYVQDPIEGLRRRKIGLDETVYSFGGRLITSYTFEIKKMVVKSLEPVITLGIFRPDVQIPGEQVIQSMIGLNIYFNKDARLMLNADLRFSKNRASSVYSSDLSFYVAQLMVAF